VKVRINQYAPLDDWRRLRKNKTVRWGYRYMFGALSVAGEAIFPGSLFGGDRYNPWTATVHLCSDVPAIALHEGAHAKDFTRRDWPDSYAFVTAIPFGDLWPEAIASGDDREIPAVALEPLPAVKEKPTRPSRPTASRSSSRPPA
jgi:hypothetical protein